MSALGIELSYKNQCITWDGDSVQLKSAGTITDQEVCDLLYFAHTNAPLLQDIKERHQKILDADYLKVDIDSMVDELQLTSTSKLQLKTTLKKFPIRFGGGLGVLDIKPVTIELQPNATPYKGRYYSVPKAYEAPLKQAVQDF